MAFSMISVENQGPLALITINRPEARNALTSAGHEELAAAFDDFATDARRQVAIITGFGDKAFCAGHDLKQPHPSPPLPPSGFGGLTERFDLNKPVIAAVNGVCLAGGFEIALACDLIVAAETAVFGLPEPRVGLAALSGGLQRLAREIGLKRMMRIALTGATVTAQEGYELGFVNQVVATDALITARALAAEILKCGPLSIQATKEATMRSLDMPLHDALKEQWNFPAVATMWSSRDAVEGPTAFAERRPPRWTGQ
jgi:enoyl-CoA hydratase/carnithine racemase